MIIREAQGILTEMQKWRRGEAPYDGDTPETHKPMPYTAKEYGEAIDTAIEAIDLLIARSGRSGNGGKF